LHNSESFRRLVDRPSYDDRHAALIDIVNEWKENIFGTLWSYLGEYKGYEGWQRRGFVAAYIAFHDEAQRLNRVEHVKDVRGGSVEVDAMEKWIRKHYPSGFDEKNCGFAEFSRLLDEYPV
jgi:hypothetical protein